jgi:hypothetical protein
MRAAQSTSMATDTPPSLASQLLLGFVSGSTFVPDRDHCGSGLARDEGSTVNIDGD